MKPYSQDLRERVVAACAEDGRSVGDVAAQFRVSVSFVHKLRRRQRTTGSLAALPHRGGPAPLLDAATRAGLAACVARQPDAMCPDTVLRGEPTTVALEAYKLIALYRGYDYPTSFPRVSRAQVDALFAWWLEERKRP